MRQVFRILLRFSLIGIIALVVLSAGCTQPKTGTLNTTTPTLISAGPGGCNSPDTCMAYCRQHTSECEQFCRDYPDVCSQPGSALIQKPTGSAASGGFGTDTACDTPGIKEKMMTAISKILVSPPDTLRAPNWQTKILPAGNPYPGYYYDLSTAFGPAIDSQKTEWNGMGEPPRAAGLDY